MPAPRQALVLGLGISGDAAARLLAGEGWKVTAVDAADTPSVRARAAELESAGIAVQTGAVQLPDGAWQLAIPSPGLAAESSWVSTLRGRGVPMLPEFELGWSRFRGRTIAVTGSNGKSSLVKWITDCLQAAGEDAVAAGNIGVPVCTVVSGSAMPEWLVLELSSFQLEQASAFRAEAGIVLNLVPNHLDRHGTFERYAAAKAKLFAHLRPEDLAVVPDDLPAVFPMPARDAGRRVTFGAGPDAACRYSDGRLWQDGAARVDLRGTYFGNDVLGVNAAAGLAALSGLGIPDAAVESAARGFRPLPHRMEEVARSRGIRFVDDSKATTLSATAAALAMCAGRVHLIAGGRLKETDLDVPKKMLVAHAAGVYVIGESASRLQGAWQDAVPCVSCGDLARAVKCAAAAARAGDTVLLSPGCASFDQFASYAERGERFRKLVGEWLGNTSHE